MNNIQKFEETKKALVVFQEELDHFEDEAEKKLESEGALSNEYFKAFLTALRTKELYLDRKGQFMHFNSEALGSYIQPVRIKKRKMNVIPLCFLIQLYKEDLEVKQITDEEQSDIPFTLRGFWKMDKTEKFVNELISLQIDFAAQIQQLIEDNTSREIKIKKLEKILQVLESLEIKVINTAKKQQYEIKFEEQLFKVNKRNVKLDMVPLCKMITSYYVRIMNYLEDYKKLLGATAEKGDIAEIESSLMKFMEKYFTLLVIKY